MTDINELAVLIGVIATMILGYVWYGPLFGRQWFILNNVNPDDKEAIKEAQKGMEKLYAIQIILSIFQVWTLAQYITFTEDLVSPFSNSLWIVLAFIVPTLAGTTMWTTESKERKWKRFGIQAGYQVTLFIVFGIIFWLM